MTGKRRNHVFSLLFTLLVAGVVFLAYQSRNVADDQSTLSQDRGIQDRGIQDPGSQETLTQAEVLLASQGSESGLQTDKAPVAQTLGNSAESSSQEIADDVRSSAQAFVEDDKNLLVNGGFERPSLSESGFATPPGWASRERELEFWEDGNLGISSDEGNQYIELNGRFAGRITQDVEVVPGQTYRWSFSHRARNDQDTVRTLIDGELVTDATSLPGQWRTASGLFIAARGQEIITFGIESVDDGEFGNFIDNVRFEVQAGL